MVETQIIDNSVSSVKDINKEELFDFAKEYLKKHVYVSSKRLRLGYIGIHNYRTTSDISNYYFGRVISRLVREGLIARYSPKLYKRVDVSKPVIDTNEVHLIFDDISFKNPKCYNLEHQYLDYLSKL